MASIVNTSFMSYPAVGEHYGILQLSVFSSVHHIASDPRPATRVPYTTS